MVVRAQWRRIHGSPALQTDREAQSITRDSENDIVESACVCRWQVCHLFHRAFTRYVAVRAKVGAMQRRVSRRRRAWQGCRTRRACRRRALPFGAQISPGILNLEPESVYFDLTGAEHYEVKKGNLCPHFFRAERSYGDTEPEQYLVFGMKLSRKNELSPCGAGRNKRSSFVTENPFAQPSLLLGG